MTELELGIPRRQCLAQRGTDRAAKEGPATARADRRNAAAASTARRLATAARIGPRWLPPACEG